MCLSVEGNSQYTLPALVMHNLRKLICRFQEIWDFSETYAPASHGHFPVQVPIVTILLGNDDLAWTFELKSKILDARRKLDIAR